MTLTGTKSTFSSLCFSLLTFLLCVAVAPAKAQSSGVPDDCTQVLLQRNFSLLKSNDYSKVVYLHSIDEEQFKRIKQEAGANVPGYFSGEWKDFQDEKRRLKEATGYDATIEQSRSALTNIALPGATEAWVECIKANKEASAFFSKITGPPEGTKFILDVIWKPTYGVGEPPIEIVESTVPHLERGKQISPGVIGFELTRSKADEAILLTVTGKSGSLNRSFVVFVPAYKPETPSIFPYFLSPQNLINCDTPGKDCFQQQTIDGGFNSIFTPPRGRRDSKAEFRIPRGARFFKSRIGTYSCSQGAAFVFIDIDGKRVWPSPSPASPNWPQVKDVTLPIPENAQRITLIANNAGNDWCDDVVWIYALFYR